MFILGPLRANSHGSQVLSLKSLDGQSVQSQQLRAWKLGLTTSHMSQVLIPSMIWMPTWQHILEMKLGTCVENWVEQKLDPTLNTSPIIFLHKIMKIQLMIINHYLNVS